MRVYDTVAGQALTVGAATLTLYGEALTADDTYFYNDEFALVRGLADGAGRASLNDTNGGTDTINAAQLSAAATINLTAGATSTLAGSTFQIAANAVIENAIGGDGADTIIGNAAANVLRGNRGNDILNGGDGSDTAVYKGLRANYTITRNNDGSYTVVDGTAEPRWDRYAQQYRAAPVCRSDLRPDHRPALPRALRRQPLAGQGHLGRLPGAPRRRSWDLRL